MIRVEGLRAGYRAGFRRTWREVLRGVDFHVPRGSVTGYLGVNGAGKTTTIKILVGVNPPAAGRVRIAGRRAGSIAARRLLGYFPEAPFFYDGLTARELLAFYGRLSGVGAEGRAEQLLDRVGLGEAADQPVAGFSKGMRQRLGLAQALLHDPELLVLDEPLDGLDPMGRLHLRRLIAEEGRRGRTVFFSSHVLGDVEAVSDHLVVLDGGVVSYQGSVADLTQGADRGVDVRFQGVAEEPTLESIAAAAGRAPSPLPDGGREVACPGREAADRVVDLVRGAGGSVSSLQPRRVSLEDYFLAHYGAATGEGEPAHEEAEEAGEAEPAHE